MIMCDNHNKDDQLVYKIGFMYQCSK